MYGQRKRQCFACNYIFCIVGNFLVDNEIIIINLLGNFQRCLSIDTLRAFVNLCQAAYQLHSAVRIHLRAIALDMLSVIRDRHQRCPCIRNKITPVDFALISICHNRQQAGLRAVAHKSEIIQTAQSGLTCCGSIVYIQHIILQIIQLSVKPFRLRHRARAVQLLCAAVCIHIQRTAFLTVFTIADRDLSVPYRQADTVQDLFCRSNALDITPDTV